MEVILRIICVISLVFSSVESSGIPVGKCNVTDKACMITAGQKMVPVFTGGMPEYGVESTDPLKNFAVIYDLPSLNFSLTEGTVKGFKNDVINDVNWDTNKKVFTVAFTGNKTIDGKYIADGKVFEKTISGNGHAELKMKNLFVKLLINYDIEKEYVKPTNYSFSFVVKDGASFNFTNLFNGNKELSDDMISYLNKNWKKIYSGFGKPLIDSAVKQIYKNIAIFFAKIPIKDIANI